jgi:hypothetical protein
MTAPTTRSGRRIAKDAEDDAAARKWAGPTRHYDLVKEFVVATVAVLALSLVLATALGSPDDKAVTLQKWAQAAPADFVATTVTELGGTSATATYGVPYNNTPGAGQKLGPFPLVNWIGRVREPINTAEDFVLTPLSAVPDDSQLAAAVAEFRGASATQQGAWTAAYLDALAKAPNGDPSKVAPGDYGPVPLLAGAELVLAQSGGLDGALTRSSGFYASDYTKPLLFLADGSYLAGIADSQHLSGDQWGMMNETGNYPGQPWLWLYTFWYQVAPFNASGNGDALVWGLMMVLSAALVLLPFIPGLRSLPRHLGVHRLIWRDYYRHNAGTGSSGT